MAYQNVGTPRFYIDWMQYAKALGIGQISSPDYPFPFGLDISPTSFDTPLSGGVYKSFRGFSFTAPIPKLNYIAMLGHNLGSMTNTSGFHMRLDSDIIANDYVERPSDYEIINGDFSSNYNAEYDGFSIVKCTEPTTPDGANQIVFRIQTGATSETVKVSAMSTGSIYDMPHSPDLNLKLTYEYDGVKTIQTKGGATLSNASYTKPADWGDRGAWQLGDVDGQGLSNLRSGRRVWDLSFSYLSDTDVMPVNASSGYTTTIGSETGYASGDLNANQDEFTSNILDGTDFFSQVINKTMGGHLPFIFQPDKENNNPDQFAICRFDMKSFTYDQVANNVYNVKLKIRESW